MALQGSGQISLNDVNIELGNASGTQIGLGDSAVRDLFGVASGAISLSDGYDASAGFAPFSDLVSNLTLEHGQMVYFPNNELVGNYGAYAVYAMYAGQIDANENYIVGATPGYDIDTNEHQQRGIITIHDFSGNLINTIYSPLQNKYAGFGSGVHITDEDIIYAIVFRKENNDFYVRLYKYDISGNQLGYWELYSSPNNPPLVNTGFSENIRFTLEYDSDKIYLHEANANKPLCIFDKETETSNVSTYDHFQNSSYIYAGYLIDNGTVYGKGSTSSSSGSNNFVAKIDKNTLTQTVHYLPFSSGSSTGFSGNFGAVVDRQALTEGVTQYRNKWIIGTEYSAGNYRFNPYTNGFDWITLPSGVSGNGFLGSFGKYTIFHSNPRGSLVVIDSDTMTVVNELVAPVYDPVMSETGFTSTVIYVGGKLVTTFRTYEPGNVHTSNNSRGGFMIWS